MSGGVEAMNLEPWIGLIVGAVIGTVIFQVWRELHERWQWYKMFGHFANRKWRQEHTIPLKTKGCSAMTFRRFSAEASLLLSDLKGRLTQDEMKDRIVKADRRAAGRGSDVIEVEDVPRGEAHAT